MPQHATATRPRTAPVHPRRVSGPVRRPVPAGPPLTGRTGPFERLSRLPDHYVVDRLLRGRACIWVVGIMLGGIVAMQVSLLRLNAGISRAVQTQSTLELQNASLQASIAELTSGERVRAAAAAEAMVDPPAGDTRYLRARPATDPRRAVRRMRPPSQRARDIMANGGVLPGSLAGTAGTLPGPTGTALPGTSTTVPAATPDPAAATGTAPPSGTVEPTGSAPPTGTAPPAGAAGTTAAAPTATPAADPATGAATAPQG
jgi:hypothetical protein